MTTEIESAWSPAKRFTLVNPTFKGLEQAKLTASDGAADDYFASISGTALTP